MATSFQRMKSIDEYSIGLGSQESRDKMHNEAIRRRGYLQMCPICGLYREFITNVHCVQEHGMTKKEVEKKYGRIVAGSSGAGVKEGKK